MSCKEHVRIERESVDIMPVLFEGRDWKQTSEVSVGRTAGTLVQIQYTASLVQRAVWYERNFAQSWWSKLLFWACAFLQRYPPQPFLSWKILFPSIQPFFCLPDYLQLGRGSWLQQMQTSPVYRQIFRTFGRFVELLNITLSQAHGDIGIIYAETRRTGLEMIGTKSSART